jgi:tRNA U34 2-thiouridine synthase MnmA/TrmU
MIADISLQALSILSRSLRPLSSTPIRHALSTSASALPLRWGPPPPGAKVFVACSGGIDSSVAARLLLESYDITPVFMRNWDTLDEASGSGGCEWEKDWADVERLCRESLGGVQPVLVDLSKEYWSKVFEGALDRWSAGVTPNPDVTCNQ